MLHEKILVRRQRTRLTLLINSSGINEGAGVNWPHRHESGWKNDLNYILTLPRMSLRVRCVVARIDSIDSAYFQVFIHMRT